MKVRFTSLWGVLLVAWSTSSLIDASHGPKSHKHSSGNQQGGDNSRGKGKGGTTSINAGTTGKGQISSSPITGGGSATPQAPKDLLELQSWLSDSTPRVILINKTFDFSQGEGNITAQGCAPFASCQNGNFVQEARNFDGWCQQHSSTHKSITVSFRESALKPLFVASQKTILGVGSAGIIKGKGLYLWKSMNVIIRNIVIADLNPHLVWGGDAIMMDAASDVLIDHCTFSLIGRQMIVTGGTRGTEANTNVQILNNHFEGKTLWSAQCQNQHYWAVLLTGPGDTVTMANNCFDSTSGRSPKVGGAGNPNVIVHYYNNLHTNTIGETFEVAQGGKMLAEGNVFQNARFLHPSNKGTEYGGSSYVPMSDADAQACQDILGRTCVKNLIVESSPYQFGLNKTVLQFFKEDSNVRGAKILSASSIQGGVPNGCGIGHI